VRTWIKCTDANGQIIHVNLDNAATSSETKFGTEVQSLPS
jgi:hypothetical protein